MSESVLIPAVDQRLGALLECSRRLREESQDEKRDHAELTITLSREFGCEAYLVGEQLRVILEQRTNKPWVLMDKALLEEIGKRHDISPNMLAQMGEKNRIIDEVLSTFSSRWKSEKDHFRLLCRQIVSLAEQGNMILVGRGSSIITQPLKNCRHFRLYASMEFKVRSITRRLGISSVEAEDMIEKKQKQRDRFIRDFLDRDARDLSYYHLVFNNDKNSVERMASLIADYSLSA